jgi:small subunit ribosomal protein S21
LPEVNVRKDEPIEKAIRRFKKLCNREGLIKEIKKRKNYIKPSEKRRRHMSRGKGHN